MYLERRPTAVTVIGWAWLVIGALLGLSALGAISMVVATEPDLAFSGGYAFGCVFQLVAAVVAMVSATAFLRLRPWSRAVLEGLTWLLLLFTVGFMIFWQYSWLTATMPGADRRFSITGAVMGAIILAVYGAPLVAMLRSLRSDKLRQVLAAGGGVDLVQEEGGA